MYSLTDPTTAPPVIREVQSAADGTAPSKGRKLNRSRWVRMGLLRYAVPAVPSDGGRCGRRPNTRTSFHS